MSSKVDGTRGLLTEKTDIGQRWRNRQCPYSAKLLINVEHEELPLSVTAYTRGGKSPQAKFRSLKGATEIAHALSTWPSFWRQLGLSFPMQP